MITSPGALPPEYLQALGEIVVQSGRLEDALTPVLARAVGGDMDGVSALLGADSLNAKIGKLTLLASRETRVNGELIEGALNRVVPENMAGMLRGLALRCDRARIARNRVVHSVWSLNQAGEVVRTRETLHAQRRTEQVVVPLSELAEVAHELADAVQAVHNASYDQLTGTVHDDWAVSPGPGD